MKLSIIIAVYNIEDYIGACLNSCLEQEDVEYADYEIIAVNDGSTDSSPAIIEQYASKYPNVVVITRSNGGLSEARNTGLKLAKGDYVWFVDGDDIVQHNSVAELCRVIDSNSVDSIIFNYSTFIDIGKTLLNSRFDLPRQTFVPRDFILRNKRILPMMAWLTVSRRRFLIEHDLYFTPGILHEDLDFSVRSFSLSENAYYLNKHLYDYRLQRQGSIMTSTDNSRKIKSYESYLRIEQIWDTFFRQHNVARRLRNLAMSTIAQFVLFSSIADQHFKTKKTSHKKRYYKKLLWQGSTRCKIKYVLHSVFPLYLCKRFVKGFE